jgi:hypothetical protein
MRPTRAATLIGSLIAASSLYVLPGCAIGTEADASDDSSVMIQPLSAGEGIVFNTGGAGLNVRKTPSLTAAVVGHLAESAHVKVTCQTTGASVQGTTVWNYLGAQGGYVSDAFLYTGYNGFIPGVPKCNTSGGTSSSSSQPTCGCYYGNGAYCGAGVVSESAKRGCTVAIAAAHKDDLLLCQNGSWTVQKDCSAGCTVAPAGQNDTCKGSSSSSSGYHLPWGCGVSFACTQTPGGPYSHTGSMAGAYDFGMPRGTNVRAARGGTVTHADNLVGPGNWCYDGCTTSSCCSSCINTANRVKISHGDGTSALYLHLDKATVQVGQVVSAGQLIGRSGTSGCSFGPHLHFQAQEDCSSWFCKSINIKFAEAPSVYEGQWLKSNNCQ